MTSEEIASADALLTKNAALQAELDILQAAASAAARTLIQKDARISELEWQLDQARELLRALEARQKADGRAALDELARMQARLDEVVERNGYLGRLVEILRDAAQPTAGLLIDISHLPLDEHTRETIQAVLTPLEAAIAASNKARTE